MYQHPASYCICSPQPWNWYTDKYPPPQMVSSTPLVQTSILKWTWRIDVNISVQWSQKWQLSMLFFTAAQWTTEQWVMRLELKTAVFFQWGTHFLQVELTLKELCTRVSSKSMTTHFFVLVSRRNGRQEKLVYRLQDKARDKLILYN